MTDIIVKEPEMRADSLAALSKKPVDAPAHLPDRLTTSDSPTNYPRYTPEEEL